MATLTGQVVGRYQILERVGQGGMATVYKAYDPVEGRNVAVKVLSSLAADSPHFTARFQREAKVVSELRHPNIVPVWDYGQDDDMHYLVMPLLEMGSLSDRLMNGPLKPRESGRVVKQVTEALDYAHQHGVVHRDMKPSNILLDEEGNALVSDFGLVYIQDASVSLTGSALIGTPAYMSPEQAQGEKVTPATDQYAFGIVLYELATGQLPYDGETPMAVAIKHITNPMPFPRERNPNVPAAVEHVILKATAKDPGDRFESMAMLGEAYKAALDHALDPNGNALPRLELPASVLNSHLTVPLDSPQGRPKKRVMTLVLLAAAMLLALVFCPAGPLGLPGIMQRLSGSAEGTVLTVADLSAPQLTAMSGTLQVMSTQLAEAQGTQLSPEDMQTAVVGAFLGTQGSESTIPVGLGDPKRSPTSTATGPSDGTAAPGASSTVPPTPTTGPTVPGQPSNTPNPSATTGAAPSATSPLPTLAIPTTVVPTLINTPGLPSWTPTATRTLTSSPTITPSPTSTSPPPTPTMDPCSQLNLGGFQVGGQEVEIEVINNSGVALKIVGLHLDWPPANSRLKKIELSGDEIWNGADNNPPTDIPAEGGWNGPSFRRWVGAGAVKPLVLFFNSDADSSGYWLNLEFDNGCTISAGQ